MSSQASSAPTITENTATNDTPSVDQRVPNVQTNSNMFNLNGNIQWARPENMDQYTVHMQMMQQAYLQYMAHYMNV